MWQAGRERSGPPKFTLRERREISHQEQAKMIRRYIVWRNDHAYDERLRRIVDRANVA